MKYYHNHFLISLALGIIYLIFHFILGGKLISLSVLFGFIIMFLQPIIYFGNIILLQALYFDDYYLSYRNSIMEIEAHYHSSDNTYLKKRIPIYDTFKFIWVKNK